MSKRFSRRGKLDLLRGRGSETDETLAKKALVEGPHPPGEEGGFCELDPSWRNGAARSFSHCHPPPGFDLRRGVTPPDVPGGLPGKGSMTEKRLLVGSSHPAATGMKDRPFRSGEWQSPVLVDR